MKVRSEGDKAVQRRFLLRLAATDGKPYTPELEKWVHVDPKPRRGKKR